MTTEATQARVEELEDEVSELEEDIDCLKEDLEQLERYRIRSDEALSSYRSGRIVAMLDDLEKALPSEFIGFADDILKWAGKTR